MCLVNEKWVEVEADEGIGRTSQEEKHKGYGSLLSLILRL